MNVDRLIQQSNSRTGLEQVASICPLPTGDEFGLLDISERVDGIAKPAEMHAEMGAKGGPGNRFRRCCNSNQTATARSYPREQAVHRRSEVGSNPLAEEGRGA